MVSKFFSEETLARAAAAAGAEQVVVSERGILVGGKKIVFARGESEQARNQRRALIKKIAEKAAREKAAREKAAREKAAREKAAREKAARDKARADVVAERNRIIEIRRRLRDQGAQRRVQRLRDATTGDRLRRETIRNNRTGETIIITTNLRTGKVSTRTFIGKGRRGRQTGGLEKTPGRGFIVIKKSVVKGKLVVTMPNGKKFKISDTGVVVVGAELAGEKLRFVDGKLVGRTAKGEKTEIEILRAPISTLTEREKKFRREVKGGVGVQKVPEAKGVVKKILRKLENLQKKQSTKSIRKKQRGLKNELSLLGLTTGLTIVAGVGAFIALPKTAVSLARNPKQLLGVPSAIGEGGVEFAQLIRISPTEALGKIAGEIIFLKGIGKTLEVVGKVSSKTATRLSPKFVALKRSKIIISTSKGKTTIKVGGTVRKIAEPISKQAKLAGKKVTAVSAQADEIVKLIRRKRIVRKPIPGEAGLSKTTRRLLRRFDAGKITKKQLNLLDDAIRKETKGAGSLLERSFFADPRGRFRPSRLGLQEGKRASLVDILSGDVTFRTNKPQILVFKNVRIQKFPAALKDIEKALKAGKPLTPSQLKRFVQFQQQQSGKFKPVGGLTREPEITLAPGEIIKKVKKVGVTLINGRRVSIVEAKVVQATKRTSQLLKKSKVGKITPKEIKELIKRLSKETGFKTSLSRGRIGKPRARVTGRPLKIKRRVEIKRRITRRAVRKQKARITRRVTTIKKRKRVKRPRRKPPRRPPGRPPPRRKPPRRPPGRPPPRRKPPRRPPGRPPGRPPVIPPRIKKKRLKRIMKKRKGKNSFDVFARPLKKRKKGKKPKLIKINKRPLSQTNARDLRNYIIDTSLSRTGKIKGRKGRPKKSKLTFPRGYAKKTTKKFRRFRIVKGKRKPLRKGKVIERRGRLLDTRQERRKITLRRRIKQITPRKKRVIKSKAPRKRLIGKAPSPQKKRSPTRKINGARRAQLLRNLQKARMVKARLQSQRRRKRSASRTQLRRKISII